MEEVKQNSFTIGNWYLINGKPTKISRENIQEILNSQCQPILLTPEILVKYGFEKFPGREDYYFLKCDPGLYPIPFYIEYITSNMSLYLNEGLIPRPIRYLDELQDSMRLCNVNKDINIDMTDIQ